MFFVFLTSGLFLGWSLGANDAANVYGTAVATRMLKFRTAAIAAAAAILRAAVVGWARSFFTEIRYRDRAKSREIGKSEELSVFNCWPTFRASV